MAAAAALTATATTAGASTITYVRDGHIVAMSSYTGSTGSGSTTSGTDGTSTGGAVTDGSVTGSTGSSPGTGGTAGSGAGTGGTTSGATFGVGTPGTRITTATIRAYNALATHALPVPVPVLAPRRAVTGVRSYLRITGPASDTFTLLDRSGVGGAIAYDCRAVRATVAWGDGTTTVTTSRGAPPRTAGSIGHLWTRRGSAVVSVASEWSCGYTYTSSGVTGTLAVRTAGSVTVPIDEVQPVLVR